MAAAGRALSNVADSPGNLPAPLIDDKAKLAGLLHDL